MFSRLKHAAAGLTIAHLLSACVAHSPAPITDRTGHVPTTPPPIDSGEGASTQYRDGTPAPNEKATIVTDRSPARELLILADRHLGSGDYDSAAAVINRAIQIAPGDALSWHKLAQLHYLQGRYGQAVSVAKRSNALASAGPKIRQSNWRLIESVERAKGNSAAADAAALEATK